MSADVSSPPTFGKRTLNHSGFGYGNQSGLKRRQCSPAGSPYEHNLHEHYHHGMKRGIGQHNPSNRCHKRLRTLEYGDHHSDHTHTDIHREPRADHEHSSNAVIEQLRATEHELKRTMNELENTKEEGMRWKSRCEEVTQECAELSEQTKVLKRAVTIQNQQKQEGLAEVEKLKKLLYEAAQRIHRLEQTNYALTVHLQQNGCGNDDFFSDSGHPPPNVF